MQTTTRYRNRRSYIEVTLLLAVALLAASFGHWVIPSGGSRQGITSAANETSAVPSSIESRLTDLKQAQLDSQDRLDGFGRATSPGTSFEDTHPERFAALKQAQLDRADGSDGGALSGTSLEYTLPERFAALKQAQLDAEDRADGLTNVP
jgi:hypothetical protein